MQTPCMGFFYLLVMMPWHKHLWINVISIVCIALLSACNGHNRVSVDELNEKAYAWHYRDLDSAKLFADSAYNLSKDYATGRAEAMNNRAFISIAKMNYRLAARQLDSVFSITDNQIELLIADVQQMRLCQRESRNQDFYDYRERAQRRMRRINDEAMQWTTHEQKRIDYGFSEFYIVASTYFYYVGLTQQSIDNMAEINPESNIVRDTAQILNYWYNVGAGGILTQGTAKQIAQDEFDYLLRCYAWAQKYHYVYWEAQALQSMSEHLQSPDELKRLIRDNLPAVQYINSDNMPDSLLAGNLAQRALDIFTRYSDVYQIAGANRTLAECYWHIGDNRSALICLNRALNDNRAIHQAPDLVASIREYLCLVYSAMNDKVNSDRNRNLYLDVQEQTRQDRELEARARQLNVSSRQLNLMLLAVLLMIVIVLVLLYAFSYMRRRSDERFSLDSLLEPLRQWQEENRAKSEAVAEKHEEITEQTNVVRLHLTQNKRRNLEQRAKIQLVNSNTPFINRMVNAVERLQKEQKEQKAAMDPVDGQTKEQSMEAQTQLMEAHAQRYQYISDLVDTINDYNAVLTQWIQMRQGDISLKIESFPLQPLFDMLSRGRMSYQMKGVTLDVKPTEAVVKADKPLTLFMINTIADNARKFTPAGGTITIGAEEGEGYVEVSIADTGQGMTEEQLSHVFDRTYTGGHGFGLKNCNGIIEKYKKISRIFAVCAIKAESRLGQGTRIAFRLPKGIASRVLKGIARIIIGLLAFAGALLPSNSFAGTTKARQFADSAYFCNINGQYARTLQFVDSCQKYLSERDTSTRLDISNEAAVAALALHRWDDYHNYNKVYTQLFRQASTDNSLPDYVRMMQRSEGNKTVAIILLVLLLIIIFPAYYFLYYRHRLNYRFCIDRINAINRLLLSDASDTEKLTGIKRLGDFNRFSLSDEQKRNLTDIVTLIEQALRLSIKETSQQQTDIELAEDDLRRMEMDNDRLHVSNSVLDNCLSTLKHETMYYPSRIKQLIDGTDRNLEGIAELSSFYKELYGVLSLQAMRQIGPIRLDKDMTDYLFELLKKLNNDQEPQREISENGALSVVKVMLNAFKVSPEECQQLFTPYTRDIRFLLVRQIVREMGEATNLRACGVDATLENSQLVVQLTVPKRCLDFRKQYKQKEKHILKYFL